MDKAGRRTIPLLAAVLALVVLAAIATMAVTAGDEGDGQPAAEEHDQEAVEADCGPWDALASGAAVERTPDVTPLMSDPDLRQGQFDSGLRYYVRSNGRPGRSASLALAVSAGAALEDDDQHGAAHYLEHMLFNGTEGFPGDELPDVLRSLGVEPGADLNAFTSEDETVYHLELGNDDDSIDRGLDVLLEWATRATITPEDTEDERGVILEELRSDLGPESRFFDRVRDLSLAGTRYAGHEVIGTTESIEAMTPEALRRFYEDWYRPDLLSVIAVGDFDAAAMEAEIRDRFAPIAAPNEARAKPALDSQLAPGPRVGSYVDDELAGTSAEVVFTRPSEPLTTMEDLRRQVVRDVGVVALDQRLNDDAARGLVPFYEVDVEVLELVREFESLMLSVDAEPEQLGDALESMIHELARMRRHGLTESEVADAVAVRRAQSLSAEAGVTSTQDRELLFRFIDSTLAEAPTTTSDTRAQAELAILEGITAADVAEEFGRITTCGDMAVQAGVPGQYEDWLPGDDDIATMIRAATSGDLPARPGEPAVQAAIMAAPEPVRPVRRADDADLFGSAVFLEYANGARVVINPTDVAAGRVTLVGESPGGLAEVDPADLPNARAAGQLVSDSGAGELDSVALQRLLAGKDAYAVAAIGPDQESIDAGGAATDMETIFQLVHQRMVAPRIDDGAVATYRGESRLIAEDPYRRADSALMAAIDELVWQDDGRLRHLTTAADLEALDPQRALALHRERFGDVGDFDFVLVGDVDPAMAEDLAHRYIGSLPSAGRVEDGTYTQPPPRTAAVSRQVEAGTAPQASIEVVFDVEVDVDPTLRDRADVLRAILDDQLRARIREELGATYGATISIDVDDRAGRVRTSINVSSDPQGIDEVAEEIRAVVDGLRDPGPTDGDVERAMEPILRDLQFFDHQVIVTTWLYLMQHPDRPVQDAPFAAELRLEGVGPEVVQDLAGLLLPADAYVEVVQVPAPR